jgi:tetratricopeptide (TPR) repeat protein
LVYRTFGIQDRPFQLWVDVLRSLALFTGLTDEEAAALKPFVPDLKRLVGREIPGGMAIIPQEAGQGLTETVGQLLARLDQPAIILLEDLQWSGNESMQLLGELALRGIDQAVILVGSYRDDERLPEYDHLEAATFLSLQRLTEEDTAELSASILGQAGSDPQLVSLLHRETEGNAFFLGEAMRTLAEEAGQLDQVSQMTYPESIMSGGIREILNRRLDRVPVEARPLLNLASVASRQLDLALLQVLEPGTDLEAWLVAVANAAVFETQGENWRFTHDKLREEIKGSLSHGEHVALHRRVAEGLERLYPGAPEQAAALAFHWSIVGDPEKELYYSETAGRHAAGTSAAEDAITFFQRALELVRAQPASPARDERELSIRVELGPQLTMARGVGIPEMESTYLRAQELSVKTGETNALFQAIWGQWLYYDQVIDFRKSRELTKQLLRLAEESNDDSFLVAALHAAWTGEFAQGYHAVARDYFDQGFEVYDPELHNDHTQLYGHDSGMCLYMHGGLNCWIMGYPDQTLQLSREGQALAGKLGRPLDRVFAELGSGLVTSWRREYKDAFDVSNAILKLSDELGSMSFGVYGMLDHGAALTGQGQQIQGQETR